MIRVFILLLLFACSLTAGGEFPGPEETVVRFL